MPPFREYSTCSSAIHRQWTPFPTPDESGNYNKGSVRRFVGNADLRSLRKCVSPKRLRSVNSRSTLKRLKSPAFSLEMSDGSIPRIFPAFASSFCATVSCSFIKSICFEARSTCLLSERSPRSIGEHRDNNPRNPRHQFNPRFRQSL